MADKKKKGPERPCGRCGLNVKLEFAERVGGKSDDVTRQRAVNATNDPEGKHALKVGNYWWHGQLHKGGACYRAAIHLREIQAANKKEAEDAEI